MVKIPNITGLEEAARHWQQVDLRSLLAESALAIGAGSSTDAGLPWTLPTPLPDPIILAGGVPDPATLPVDDLRDSFDRVLSTSSEEALRYGGVPGFEGLRTALAERQSRIDGVPLEPDNFVINNGSAGGIDSICDAFVEPGDVVIVEGPTFSGSLRTMRGHLAEIIEVPMDDDGVLVDEIPVAIRKAEGSGKRVKLMYTVTDFHNPTGTTLSPERRSELVRLCAEHHVLIVEDAAYADIRFGEAAPSSLYALAQGQGILKAGTFSKCIATGLRLGWVQGRADYIEALVRVRFDMGNSPLLQRAIADYMAGGKLDAHLEEVRPVYAEKCRVLCQSLLSHCQPYVRFKKPDGGFFLWVECIGPRSQEVAREAAEKGVIFPVGSTFFLDGEDGDTTHIRLAFSTATLEQLAQVGPRLRAAFDRAIGER